MTPYDPESLTEAECVAMEVAVRLCLELDPDPLLVGDPVRYLVTQVLEGREEMSRGALLSAAMVAEDHGQRARLLAAPGQPLPVGDETDFAAEWYQRWRDEAAALTSDRAAWLASLVGTALYQRPVRGPGPFNTEEA